MKITSEMWDAWKEATQVGVDEWKGRLPKNTFEWQKFNAWRRALAVINRARRK